MAPALLTAVDSASHIHLIVGSNPLAGARCTRSIEVGANPILIAPEDATLHYGLVKRIEEGEVKWLKRSFQEEDLTTLGRAEVDGVVDAVFVTAGGKQGQSMSRTAVLQIWSDCIQARRYPTFAAGYGFPSMSPMRPTFAPSPSFPHIPTALSRLA